MLNSIEAAQDEEHKSNFFGNIFYQSLKKNRKFSKKANWIAVKLNKIYKKTPQYKNFADKLYAFDQLVSRTEKYVIFIFNTNNEILCAISLIKREISPQLNAKALYITKLEEALTSLSDKVREKHAYPPAIGKKLSEYQRLKPKITSSMWKEGNKPLFYQKKTSPENKPKKEYHIKAEINCLGSAEAFLGMLYQYLIGIYGAPKYRPVIDDTDNSEYIYGVRSTINSYFKPAAETRLSFSELIASGAIELMTSAYLLGEVDLHLNNFGFVIKEKIILHKKNNPPKENDIPEYDRDPSKPLHLFIWLDRAIKPAKKMLRFRCPKCTAYPYGYKDVVIINQALGNEFNIAYYSDAGKN